MARPSTRPQSTPPDPQRASSSMKMSLDRKGHCWTRHYRACDEACVPVPDCTIDVAARRRQDMERGS